MTYVNKEDARFIEDRRKCANLEESAHAHATHERRFKSSGEIYGCIKSILKFAPWVRKLFLVVAYMSQVETDPKLFELVQQHRDRIQIVEHSSFIAHDALPTFNSFVIEAHFCRIDALSEFFIKFDDDFFLGRPAEKADFLSRSSDGAAQMHISLESKEGNIAKYTDADSNLYQQIVAYNYRLMRSRYQQKRPQWQTRMISHCPQIQQKSLLTKLIDVMFPREFEAMRRNRFRAKNDLMIVSLLSHHVALYEKSADFYLESAESFMYVDVSMRNREMQLQMEKILTRPPKTFCLNNTIVRSDDDSLDDVAKFLEKFDA